MLRSVLGLFPLIFVVSLGACLDLGSSPCAKGECGAIDPPPERIEVGCIANTDPGPFVFEWDLSVAPRPRPILAGEPFVVESSGVVRIHEYALDEAQGLVPGGYKRAHVVALKATVHVRSGVTEGGDIVLTVPHGGETCAYDEEGRTGPKAGPEFPSCSPSNDVGGGNSDCTGLIGKPDPRNPCGQFVEVPWSDVGEECTNLNKADQWSSNGFCITGDVEVFVQGPVQGYRAGDGEQVLFGWDDESTSAVLDDTIRPQDPIWKLTTPDFDSEPGPNSLRARVRYDWYDGGFPIALECTMASGPPGLLRPTPDSELISFPITRKKNATATGGPRPADP